MVTSTKLSLIEIARRVRSDLTEHFDDKFSFSVNTVQDGDPTGLVAITVTQWPDAMEMLSREFIRDNYLAVLEGRMTEMSPTLMLSKNAEEIVWDIRSILDCYVKVYINPKTGLEERNFISDIAFSQTGLVKERRRLIDECKQSFRHNSQLSGWPEYKSDHEETKHGK